MFRKAATVLAGGALVFSLAACSTPDTGGGGGGTDEKGLIAVITVDLGNPYWQAEANTAEKVIADLGYESSINAHNGDPSEQDRLIDAAISSKAQAIILDPAGADESVAAVQKATDADIPVFLVNAEISEQGIAKSQIVSNNAQGATIGAEAWVESMGGAGTYVELFGDPTDNNAQVRSDGYAAVISAYPDLSKVGMETANWDRAEGKSKMEGLLAAHPDLTGVIAGNDEMALGAIEALTDAGKIGNVKVLGFDGNADAVEAVKAGTMIATVLQPIVAGTTAAIEQADSFIRTGETGVSEEKQSIDCVLINPDNTASYVSPFVLEN